MGETYERQQTLFIQESGKEDQSRASGFVQRALPGCSESLRQPMRTD